MLKSGTASIVRYSKASSRGVNTNNYSVGGSTSFINIPTVQSRKSPNVKRSPKGGNSTVNQSDRASSESEVESLELEM